MSDFCDVIFGGLLKCLIKYLKLNFLSFLVEEILKWQLHREESKTLLNFLEVGIHVPKPEYP